MFTHAELLAMNRALRTTRVLSLYVDFTATDPAVQRAWRIQLERTLSEVERMVAGAPREERVQFEQCLNVAREILSALDSSVGSPGWAAFITADGVRAAVDGNDDRKRKHQCSR